VTIIHSFDPVIDENSRVLILGSMPGQVSLAQGQYYAHPQNQFWKLIFSIFNIPPCAEYTEKTSFLKSRKIALWDVIKECQRSGSSDSKIINPVINDFGNLFIHYSNIHCILFNGKKAGQLFEKYNHNITPSGIEFITLPSSSPANAGISLNNKLEAWSRLKSLTDL
jgi:hypoxanthine-DNA glycosylase